MKTKLLIFLLPVAVLFIYPSCHKNSSDEDPHNHSLRKKSLDEIHATIAGTWQIKRACGCGFVGCFCNNWPDIDYVSFLPDDTVKRVANGITAMYEKAVITREYIYAYNDTGYLFSKGGGFQLWAMDQIKNDSLLISDDPNTYYLAK
jgi:hypothetical protein